jgi:hypothetical protein
MKLRLLMENKICSKCHIEQPITEFNKRGDRNSLKSWCKSCIRNSEKLYKEKNPTKYKDWYYNNIKERSEYRSRYRSEKRKNDPMYRVICNSRERLKNFLKSKNIDKKNKSFDIIGCSPQELKNHLEKQFSERMCWENYGYYGWHIDHIIPLDSGKTEDEILKLFHFTNLQPLWWIDNLNKGSKIY